MAYKNVTLSTNLLIKRAKELGIQVTQIFPGGKFFEFKHHNHKEYLRAQITSATTSTADFILKHKDVTKHFMKKGGVSVTRGRTFTTKNAKEAMDYAHKIGYPVIIKPLEGTHGDLVFMDIKNRPALKTAIRKYARHQKRFLLEKQFEGNEYRIIATPEKVLGVIYRIPANVIGDSEHTIGELIDLKNDDPRRGASYSYSLIKIKIDSQVRDNLKKQNYSLGSVPPAGKVVYLRKNSNLSTGGDSIDMTDDVHPSVKEIAIKAIQSIPGLPYAGIDFITKDVNKEQTRRSYQIIEMNETPMLSMHHIPYQGQPRDVAGEIIYFLFPELKKEKIKKAKKPALGLIEIVKLTSAKKRTFSLEAKIDTGAHKTSIDLSLAKKMGFEKVWQCFNREYPEIKVTKSNLEAVKKKVKNEIKPQLLKTCPGLEDVKIIPTASGTTIRPYVKITYVLKGKKIETIASIARREHMQYLMLIGKEDLQDFIIKPSKNDYNTQD
ncbi:RimK/LysX family protein [Patescibacteria group bacterium]|nr:RimK/LysX family protein [Patescibacteria group bacterium]MBU1673682.1 RimK/LysX family protein [Patescibacteria group bacterium]MBU1963492.1 RimK/LysX family protein [Patescibacteria group bacterium]